MTFTDFFQAATGNTPFPWQSRLYTQFAAGKYPTAADIPTGLGKTSVVAIWLIALALHPDTTPRRLVYVVNRRTVVDQTTAEVESIRKALTEKTELKDLAHKLRNLCALPLPSPDAPPLAISTLRGQFADNREWSADPARPAVIIGTVDMIGSGLLFSRYTVGFKLRPHHAAFLAQDALLVHDEAHLEPAFQKLLDSIVAEQSRCQEIRPLRVLELTATIRSHAASELFKMTKEDTENTFVNKRLNAVKQLSLVTPQEEKNERDTITEIALAKKESGRALLIFVRSVEDATKIATKLEKAAGKGAVLTLTGTMRGKERDELVTKPVFKRFLPESKHDEPAHGTVFLVATSAGEVGVNISADDLVCDLSTYESMVQRFGRVNRFGGRDDSTITVVYPVKFPHTEKIQKAEKDVVDAVKNAEKKLQKLREKEAMEMAREQTLALLQQLSANASPAALDKLPAAERAAAFSPPPQMRDATAIQFDAWALTSIRIPIAARPSVAPYLHGEAAWQPPETHLAWRTELDVLHSMVLANTYLPEELLEDFPLKPHELLRDTTERIVKTLGTLVAKRLANHENIPDAWLVPAFGPVRQVPLAKFANASKTKKSLTPAEDNELKELETVLAHATIILPASLGGIDPAQGLFTAQARVSSDKTDVSALENARFRLFSASPDIPVKYADAYRLIRVIDTETGKDEPVPSPARYWLWLEARKSVQAEKRLAAQPETLAAHSDAVAANLAAIAKKLFPADTRAGDPNMLTCAPTLGRGHDTGKGRRLWQQGIGNTAYDPKNAASILAKSGSSMRPRNLATHYRHEFGSINTILANTAGAQAAPMLAPFSELERDIILHLIAAHHGRARPHFPVEEILDYDATPEINAALSAEIPLRFARLQQRFGRWGLAWLESILRAADYAASAGLVADSASVAQKMPPQQQQAHRKAGRPAAGKKTSSLRVDVTNPGHFFSCCGLFELAACLAPDVLAHFEQDENQDWYFVITTAFDNGSDQEYTLYSILQKFTSADLSTADGCVSDAEDSDTFDEDDSDNSDSDSTEEKAPPLKLGSPFHLRIDWWETATSQTAALKVWAGSMDCLRIARAMKDAVGEILLSKSALKDILFESRVVYENKKGKAKKVEPFYFDVKRGPNADSRDVGFSPNSLNLETDAAPAVEILCLIGLQRATPVPTEQPRQFFYHLWTHPLPIALLAAALSGQLPHSSSSAYHFESWFRTSQKKHKAFLAAQPIIRRI